VLLHAAASLQHSAQSSSPARAPDAVCARVCVVALQPRTSGSSVQVGVHLHFGCLAAAATKASVRMCGGILTLGAGTCRVKQCTHRHAVWLCR
jgi:hypothetical protein